ncbi:hypothetical protein [Sphingomonas sp. PP-CC-1A-547]|nr:hypothetical protein [Sphingomonas sp. PP-CC-1A-547]RKE43629.1 hypothetical protein C8J39_3398 [Sphingomonas sp. PP-CC-1A-547]TCM05854.1 hypothetical protein C8J41_10671 [Sphingomonas sp. PP-CC-3G-468]
MRVMSVELNELNFHYIKSYIAQGKLPTFTKLLAARDLVETDAGEVYPELEPWIQWPTIYTGKTYAEHQLFRLGDIAYKDQPQIWDYLETRGVSVGAISPMNASNRCERPAFFLPDPWTHTKIVAEPRAKKLFELLGKMVNDNASVNPSILEFAKQILPLALPYLSSRSIAGYFKILPMALKYKWAKAAFLDRLLADLFVALWQKHKPGFASLFLNAGAHIQHHHTYDSAVYGGDKANPAWYSKAAETDADPLLFIYEVYDGLISELMALKDAHVFISTGLSQVPNERDHYQYRIADFNGFFAKVGLIGATIRPRMSRDFLLEFPNTAAARAALPVLNKVRVGGQPLFSIEERDETLFCQVAYFGKPEGLEQVSIDGIEGNMKDEFVMVSIENAIHQSTGYHIDTLAPKGGSQRIVLTDVFDRLCAAALAQGVTASQAA